MPVFLIFILFSCVQHISGWRPLGRVVQPPSQWQHEEPYFLSFSFSFSLPFYFRAMHPHWFNRPQRIQLQCSNITLSIQNHSPFYKSVLNRTFCLLSQAWQIKYATEKSPFLKYSSSFSYSSNQKKSTLTEDMIVKSLSVKSS